MIVKSYEISKTSFDNLNKKIFLLYGENYGLKKEIKENIKSSINNKKDELETISLFENDIIKNEDNFNNLIFSGSLFSKKKIISVYNTTDKIISYLEKILNKFPEDIFLIFFSEILEKKSKLRNFFEKDKKIVCTPCYPDNDRTLELLIKEELKKSKVSLAQESINLIIRKANGDRNNVRNELEKIKILSHSKKNIDYDTIKSLVNFAGEIDIENIINICLSGDILELKKILTDTNIEITNQILIIKILSNKIKRLILIKEKNLEEKNIENILNNFRPPIFWKEKPFVKKQLGIWNFNELKKTVYDINNIEISCKKDPQNSSVILLNFISNLCKKANS